MECHVAGSPQMHQNRRYKSRFFLQNIKTGSYQEGVSAEVARHRRQNRADVRQTVSEINYEKNKNGQKIRHG